MIVSIIGSGNTATVLGRLLKQKDHLINEIIGRNKTTVEQLSEELNANAAFDLKKPNKKSDVFIIAVKDDVVADVAKQLKLDEKIIMHTAGSVQMSVFNETSKNYGVLYPLQSLRKEINYLPVIPFLIDGNNDATKETIYRLASTISNSVTIADDVKRLQYHLSAVIVSNFTNHLFTLAKDYCNQIKIDFNLLLPLIEETVNRLRSYEPSAMQTGPAIRNDETTMQLHLQMLNDFPQVKNIYEVISKSINNFNK